MANKKAQVVVVDPLIYEGVVKLLADVGSILFPEEPGCVKVKNEGNGVIRLSITCADRDKADMVAMDLMAIVDILNPHFGRDLTLVC